MEQIAFIQETDQGEPDKMEREREREREMGRGEGGRGRAMGRGGERGGKREREHGNIERNGTLRQVKVRDFSFYYASQLRSLRL